LPLGFDAGAAVIVDKQTLYEDEMNLKDEVLLIAVGIAIGLVAEKMPMRRRIYKGKDGM